MTQKERARDVLYKGIFCSVCGAGVDGKSSHRLGPTKCPVPFILAIIEQQEQQITRLRELLKMHDFHPEGRCIHCGHDEYADGGYHAHDCEYKAAMEGE